MKAWRWMRWSPTGCGMRLGLPPETTLHDVRYGEDYDGRFVWTLEISGSVPPAHFAGGYAEAVSERQPPMYFRLGGGTIKGISKPGSVVWSRIYVEAGSLKADMGLAQSVALPQEETERRWQITTPQWPMMHTVLPGISRDQFMAQHCSNHIQVAYAPDDAGAAKALCGQGGDVQRDGNRGQFLRRCRGVEIRGAGDERIDLESQKFHQCGGAVAGAIGTVAAVGPAQAQAGKAGSKATNTPGLTTDLLKQTRLPFRIGFRACLRSVGGREGALVSQRSLPDPGQ